MLNDPNRVEWMEDCTLIIAERKGKRLEFWERDSWEVRWFEALPTAARIAKAKSLFDGRYAKA
jgi:hypothetical protein